MEDRAKGIVALVTGARGGIGQAICRRLTSDGVRVIASDIRSGKDDEEVASLWLELDVTDSASWARAMSEVSARFGRLDALVNNAGISMVGRIEDIALSDWRRCQAINVEGTLLGMQAALPLLRSSGTRRIGGSSIVNMSSVAALRGAAFHSAYNASKGAVKQLSKSAALEFSALKYPIRVNTVHPGGVRTEMMDTIMQRNVELGSAESVDKAYEPIIARHPVGRLADPGEIAAGVAFLCSSDSSYMQGSELVIDGGFTA